MSRECETYTEETISWSPKDEDGDVLPDDTVDIRWAGYTDLTLDRLLWGGHDE